MFGIHLGVGGLSQQEKEDKDKETTTLLWRPPLSP
jgi:hypothetical protein